MVRGFGFPTAGAPRPAAPSAPAMEGSQFTQMLRQPEVQAALLQFGVNMLTPSSAGFGGQLGRSIGAAGAAAGRASGQRQAAKDKKRQEDLEERRFGLDEKRLGLAERETARRERGGTSLQSMFSKMKPWPVFLADQAAQDAETLMDGRSSTDLMNDLSYTKPLLELWKSQQGIGMGQQTGASTSDSGEGGGDLLAEARSAIDQGADRNEVIKILEQRGIDPTGL